jgi:hypothetical protein
VPATAQPTSSQTRFLDAVFSPDGTSVYFVQRDMHATVEEGSARQGRMGDDSVSIRQIDGVTGRVTVLRTLPPTPSIGGPLNHCLAAVLGFAPSRDLEYTVHAWWREVVPGGTDCHGTYHAAQWWDEDLKRLAVSARWEASPPRKWPHFLATAYFSGPDEILSGDQSLALLDSRAHRVRTLLGPPLTVDTAERMSRRNDSGRVERDLRMKYLSEGHGEAEADWLEMADLYECGLAVVPVVTARLLDGKELAGLRPAAIHTVSRQDYRQRLLPLLREAIEHPGQEFLPPFGFWESREVKESDYAPNRAFLRRAERAFYMDIVQEARTYVRLDGLTFELSYGSSAGRVPPAGALAALRARLAPSR